jgi:hypothetical protein
MLLDDRAPSVAFAAAGAWVALRAALGVADPALPGEFFRAALIAIGAILIGAAIIEAFSG